ncbi:SdpI family protein [uncultured Flavobacterium sp.]|uniref:SdpI family protein n=1 Tax=uncultured Flavobacterium sp. TaxID=165435 RepID=UPI00293085DC|nr:SdpI family protein [uncultured Flavobacterium sp.]
MHFTLILFTLGIVFIFVGLAEYIFPPKNRNQKGYRTKNSLRSQERWDFAQKYSAKMIMISAICLIIISFVGLYFAFTDTGGFIISLTVIVFFIFFIRQKTEKAIKNKFD